MHRAALRTEIGVADANTRNGSDGDGNGGNSGDGNGSGGGNTPRQASA
jgi:hypothetical protein